MFKDTKSVFTVHNNAFDYKFDADLQSKAKAMDVSDEALAHLHSADFEGFVKIGCAYADAVIKADDQCSASLNEIFNNAPKRVELNEQDENFSESYYNLYTDLMN